MVVEAVDDRSIEQRHTGSGEDSGDGREQDRLTGASSEREQLFVDGRRLGRDAPSPPSVVPASSLVGPARQPGRFGGLTGRVAEHLQRPDHRLTLRSRERERRSSRSLPGGAPSPNERDVSRGPSSSSVTSTPIRRRLAACDQPLGHQSVAQTSQRRRMHARGSRRVRPRSAARGPRAPPAPGTAATSPCPSRRRASAPRSTRAPVTRGAPHRRHRRPRAQRPAIHSTPWTAHSCMIQQLSPSRRTLPGPLGPPICRFRR